jgi:hypothetical protein
MDRANIVLRDLSGVSSRINSKQFVTELHDRGFARDEVVETLCLMFGVPRGAARLFVASHPAWATETALDDSDESTPALGCRGARAQPSRN